MSNPSSKRFYISGGAALLSHTVQDTELLFVLRLNISLGVCFLSAILDPLKHAFTPSRHLESPVDLNMMILDSRRKLHTGTQDQD